MNFLDQNFQSFSRFRALLLQKHAINPVGLHNQFEPLIVSPKIDTFGNMGSTGHTDFTKG